MEAAKLVLNKYVISLCFSKKELIQHNFYDLFGTIHHISGRFYVLGWLQPLRFSQPSLNLSCSFAIARFLYCYLFG